MPQPYEIADLRIYNQLQRNDEVKKQAVQEPTSEYYSVVAEENVDKEPTRASVAITEDVEPSSGNRRSLVRQLRSLRSLAELRFLRSGG